VDRRVAADAVRKEPDGSLSGAGCGRLASMALILTGAPVFASELLQPGTYSRAPVLVIGGHRSAD
jgi:hypothetical protein